MKILLIAALMLCNTLAFAQTKKFRWSTEACEFESIYDGKKYTEAQLKDTLKMLASEYFPNTIDPTPTSFEATKTLNLATLDREYAARTAALKRLNIVKTKYWETLRQKNLRELAQVYELSKATILGYTNPEKLKDVSFADSCKTKFANPLISGGDELLTTWRLVNEDSRRKNSDPERLRKLFEQQSNAPNKMNYARIEVTSFGWWNCANDFIERVKYDGTQQKEFEKLFKRTRTISCEEP